MTISGFTILRHGVEFDYPFLESLRSLVPLVDELVINVGIGTDETLNEIKKFAESPEAIGTNGQTKVKIFESEWPLDDPEKKKGGIILSEQTNLALDRCTGDWCIYLQADEVFHEEDRDLLLKAIRQADSQTEVDGILFDYTHLYGSFDVEQYSRSAYRHEVRCIRRSSGARSVGDAQSFRLPQGQKLKVVRSRARVFHYGWVRTPEAMKEKTYFMDQLYHGDYEETDQQPHSGDNYRYKRFWGLRKFKGSHPLYMKDRIREKGWHWDLAKSPYQFTLTDTKKVILDLFERLTGFRLFEYRSYRLISK